MIKREINQLAQELSEEELDALTSGKISPKAKKILKWAGIGLGAAAILTGLGIGTAAVIGRKTGKGAFGYLYDEFSDTRDDENIEISEPCNFQHYVPPLYESSIIVTAVKSAYENVQSMKFTKNGPKINFF